MTVSDILSDKVVSALKGGELIVARTDTIYGILALANQPEAVNKLYVARDRDKNKPCIILVSSADLIPGITNHQIREYSKLAFERPTTIVIKAPKDYLSHLPRQNDTLAYRVVFEDKLNKLLKTTGPLIAPSANIAGKDPARNIEEARGYFGHLVSVYVDGGEVPKDIMPSRIVSIADHGTLKLIRE